VVVSSAQLNHIVSVRGPRPSDTSNTDPGSSAFRYSSSDNSWTFNLQTEDATGVFPAGDYWVTIAPSNDPRYLPSPPFKLVLTK